MLSMHRWLLYVKGLAEVCGCSGNMTALNCSAILSSLEGGQRHVEHEGVKFLDLNSVWPGWSSALGLGPGGLSHAGCGRGHHRGPALVPGQSPIADQNLTDPLHDSLGLLKNALFQN